MAYDAIMREVKDLSDDNQAEVLDFIMFLKSKNPQKEQTSESKPYRKLNALAGKLIYMADDFDETPECFREYI